MCVRGDSGGDMTAKEDDDDHVSEWEEGLPSNEELMPLSQSLISPALASAFSIKHELTKTDLDVQRGARATLHNLRNQKTSIPPLKSYPSFQAHDNRGAHGYAGEGQVGVGDSVHVSGNRGVGSGDEAARVTGGGVNERGPLCHPLGPYPTMGTGLVARECYVGGSDETSVNPVDGRPGQGLPYMMPCASGGTSYERQPENSYGVRGDDSSKGGGGLSKNLHKRGDSESEDGDSAGCPENSSEEPNARTLKRPRLVWTPQLHKRFVDAVGHLGIKNAVPKTIMQLMNVEGLTRENVASHLQKYRLYLKRVQGLSSEGPSASDQLFASTPLPPNLSCLHYMHKTRDDLAPQPFTSPNVPMPYTAVAPCPMGPGHFNGYEHHPYVGVGRGVPQKSPRGDNHTEQQIVGNETHHNHSLNYNQTHNQPTSPPQRILTLFPTSSH